MGERGLASSSDPVRVYDCSVFSTVQAVTPYVQIYDLCMLPIAMAFLVRDGLSRGFLPGERTAILIVFASLFLLLFPIGPLIYALILFLIARRLFVYCRDISAELAARRLQDRSEAPIGLAFRTSQNERG